MGPEMGTGTITVTYGMLKVRKSWKKIYIYTTVDRNVQIQQRALILC